MNADWFEMKDVARKTYQTTTFIPLRQREQRSSGEVAHVGFQEEFYSIYAWAFDVVDQSVAAEHGWDDLGPRNRFAGYVDQGAYIPSDEDTIHGSTGSARALALVLSSEAFADEPSEWHLHQDLVLTLRLKREGDEWFAPQEGYVLAARLKRDEKGAPVLMEVARDFLLDYLTARNMGLWLVTFRQRTAVLDDVSALPWPGGHLEQGNSVNDLLRADVIAIHEGNGFPYGDRMAVFHIARTDVDANEDVPQLSVPADDTVIHSVHNASFEGRQIFRASGEWFRNEWIAPSGFSHRVRGDPEPQSTLFHVDASGLPQTLTGPALKGWLWFRPQLMQELLRFRQSHLSWYTRDTGQISITPEHDLWFGINDLGLVNVFAKDVSELPGWLQRLMAAHSVRAEGKVSSELLAAQVDVQPANTNAAEQELSELLVALDTWAVEKWGGPLFKTHDDDGALLRSCHRFRVLESRDLSALAKDVARLVLSTSLLEYEV